MINSITQEIKACKEGMIIRKASVKVYYYYYHFETVIHQYGFSKREHCTDEDAKEGETPCMATSMLSHFSSSAIALLIAMFVSSGVRTEIWSW